MVEAVDALVREFDGDAQPGVLDKPPLDGIERFHMVGEGIDEVPVLVVGTSHAVQLLVDVRQSVGPDFVLPAFCRERIPQDPAGPVQRDQLAGLLLQGHLPQQVLHPVL